MLLFNNLEDQIAFFLFIKIPENLKSFYIYADLLRVLNNILTSSEPITLIMFKLLNSVNLSLLLFFSLNIIITFYYFKKYKFGFLYTLVFSLCTYYWLHFSNHFALSQLWLYPLFFLILNFSKEKRFYMIPFLILSILTSNYIGFFILIYFSIYVFINIIFDYLVTKKIDFSILKFWGFSVLISIGSIYVLLRNFFSFAYTGISGGFRPYEDFFTFSTRPWYFLIPSPKHPVYGEFANGILEKIKSTGYFLADDYFIGEHGASFFGYFLLITFFVISFYIVYKGSKDQKVNLLRYWLINIALFLLMLPPFLTISGFKIYTPGWLIYKFFPMFRTTVRMSVLILFNILIVLASFFDDLYKNYPKKRLHITIFIILLTGITLFETFIPPKIQILDTPPEIYSYIGDTHKESKFIVYPYSATQEALFWVDAHKSYLLNPRMYKKDTFDSETFTKNLNTNIGLQELKTIDTKYLVVFKNIPDDEINFFLNSNLLKLEKEFNTAYLFSIVE